MKKLLLLTPLFLFGIILTARAQDSFDDLKVLLLDEEFEKCIKKGIKYTQSDKTKKEALPYLYISMGYFEMSKEPDKYEDFVAKPFKQAIKYAVKFRKKDKTKKYLGKELRYMGSLKEVMIEESINYWEMEEEKYTKKALGHMKNYIKIEPKSPGAWYIKTATEMKLNLSTEAITSKETVEDIMNSLNFDELEDKDQYLLMQGIILYGDYLKDAGNSADASTLVETGNKYFQDNEEFKAAYERLKN